MKEKKESVVVAVIDGEMSHQTTQYSESKKYNKRLDKGVEKNI